MDSIDQPPGWAVDQVKEEFEDEVNDLRADGLSEDEINERVWPRLAARAWEVVEPSIWKERG